MGLGIQYALLWSLLGINRRHSCIAINDSCRIFAWDSIGGEVSFVGGCHVTNVKIDEQVMKNNIFYLAVSPEFLLFPEYQNRLG